jgi:hypothetical protein
VPKLQQAHACDRVQGGAHAVRLTLKCSPSELGELCYMFSMKAKRRRAGATETFSVSVDPETKRALRTLADADFQGNMSALVTDMAEEARRRMAAGAYLRRQRLKELTKAESDALVAEIEREVAATKRRRKRRVA